MITFRKNLSFRTTHIIKHEHQRKTTFNIPINTLVCTWEKSACQRLVKQAFYERRKEEQFDKFIEIGNLTIKNGFTPADRLQQFYGQKHSQKSLNCDIPLDFVTECLHDPYEFVVNVNSFIMALDRPVIELYFESLTPKANPIETEKSKWLSQLELIENYRQYTIFTLVKQMQRYLCRPVTRVNLLMCVDYPSGLYRLHPYSAKWETKKLLDVIHYVGRAFQVWKQLTLEQVMRGCCFLGDRKQLCLGALTRLKNCGAIVENKKHLYTLVNVQNMVDSIYSIPLLTTTQVEQIKQRAYFARQNLTP